MRKTYPVRVIGFTEVPDYAKSLVQALGLAAINWGKLEQQLDMLIHAVNREIYERGTYRETPNTSFRMKVDMFQRWYAKDDRFAAVHEWAKLLVPTLRKINKDRALLFHSNVQDFVEGPPSKLHILHMRTSGNDVQITTAEWTEKEIMNFALAAARFSVGMATISDATMTPEFRKSLEKS